MTERQDATSAPEADMAVMRMHHSIDVTRYYRLPDDIRARFDFWLESNGLLDKSVVELRLAEGYVIVDRLAVDDDGIPIVDEDGETLVLTTESIVIKEPPPRDAFIEEGTDA